MVQRKAPCVAFSTAGFAAPHNKHFPTSVHATLQVASFPRIQTTSVALLTDDWLGAVTARSTIQTLQPQFTCYSVVMAYATSHVFTEYRNTMPSDVQCTIAERADRSLSLGCIGSW